MKVVSISLDPNLLDANSVAAKRVSNYGRLIESYTIIVPFPKDIEVKLANNVTVYGIGGYTKLGKLLRIYNTARRLAKEGKCDVISTDQYYFGLMGYLLAKQFHLGFEAQALGFEKFNAVRKRMAKFVFQKASSIRMNSPRLIRFAETELGITGPKLHMVPIHVHLDTLGLNKALDENEKEEWEKIVSRFREKYTGRFNFLSVNRLIPEKDIGLQLKAIAALKSSYPNVHLHVAGEGPERNVLERMIETLSIKDNVTLHGYTQGLSLGALYESCDCFLLTSWSEGWGMVIVEALNAKLPVIMTDVGSAGEIIIDGESGIVIRVKDEEALRSAMIRIIEDEPYRKKLIAGGMDTLCQIKSLDELLVMYKESWEYALQHRL